MDCSTPGSPILYSLLEFALVHVHWVGDAIHPSHPLLPSSPFALSTSQHQGLFQRFDCSQQVAKVLELQLQHQSFQWLTGLISLLSKGLSRVFSSTTIWVKGLSNCSQQASCSAACGILVPPPGHWTHIPCIGWRIHNHWTTREVPSLIPMPFWMWCTEPICRAKMLQIQTC